MALQLNSNPVKWVRKLKHRQVTDARSHSKLMAKLCCGKSVQGPETLLTRILSSKKEAREDSKERKMFSLNITVHLKNA